MLCICGEVVQFNRTAPDRTFQSTIGRIHQKKRHMTWSLIQRINAGASRKTCSFGNSNYPFDSRPYGTALEQEGHPHIQQWTAGEWSIDSIADCKLFLQEIIDRRSIAMLAVLAVARRNDPDDRITRWLEALSERDRSRIDFMVRIAIGEPEWDEYFKDWNDCDF